MLTGQLLESSATAGMQDDETSARTPNSGTGSGTDKMSTWTVMQPWRWLGIWAAEDQLWFTSCSLYPSPFHLLYLPMRV